MTHRQNRLADKVQDLETGALRKSDDVVGRKCGDRESLLSILRQPICFAISQELREYPGIPVG